MSQCDSKDGWSPSLLGLNSGQASPVSSASRDYEPLLKQSLNNLPTRNFRDRLPEEVSLPLQLNSRTRQAVAVRSLASVEYGRSVCYKPGNKLSMIGYFDPLVQSKFQQEHLAIRNLLRRRKDHSALLKNSFTPFHNLSRVSDKSQRLIKDEGNDIHIAGELELGNSLEQQPQQEGQSSQSYPPRALQEVQLELRRQERENEGYVPSEKLSARVRVRHRRSLRFCLPTECELYSQAIERRVQMNPEYFKALEEQQRCEQLYAIYKKNKMLGKTTERKPLPLRALNRNQRRLQRLLNKSSNARAQPSDEDNDSQLTSYQ